MNWIIRKLHNGTQSQDSEHFQGDCHKVRSSGFYERFLRSGTVEVISFITTMGKWSFSCCFSQNKNINNNKKKNLLLSAYKVYETVSYALPSLELRTML